MEIHLTIHGTKPMLMHNGRLADPLDPWTIELKRLTSNRKKTDELQAKISATEARAGIYETDANLLGLPSDNVWRAVYDGAKAFKQGENIKRALIPITDIEPLLVDGEKVSDLDGWIPAHIDRRTVRNQSSRIVRSRVLVPLEWQVTHRFELLTDVLDPEELDPILTRAGRVQGIGDFRPRYGTFRSEMEVYE